MYTYFAYNILYCAKSSEFTTHAIRGCLPKLALAGPQFVERLPRLHEVAAILSPSTLPGETNALHLLTARAALPQIRVETLIGSQANYEIKITIYFEQ